MTSEIDIYRSAAVLIQKHGQDAEIIAANKADERLEEGDTGGQLFWLNVVRAIKALQDERRPARLN